MAANNVVAQNLRVKFAERYGIDQNELVPILKATAFRLPPARNGEPQPVVSDAQMTALLIVADQYGLNPFTREIYAFPDKSKGIVPIVSIDGWVRIMNEHPAFDGIEFRYSQDAAEVDTHARPCPAFCESIIYRKDRSRPTVVREYLDECYRPPFKAQNGYIQSGPWQTHTKRSLRHKSLIQGARVAFGFAGIGDEDDAAAHKGLDLVAVGGDGAWELPEAGDPLAGILASFGEADRADVTAFAVASARAAGYDMVEFAHQAETHIGRFVEAFVTWRAKQGQTKAQALAARAESEIAKQGPVVHEAEIVDEETGEVVEPEAKPGPAARSSHDKAAELIGRHAKALELSEFMIDDVCAAVRAQLTAAEAAALVTDLVKQPPVRRYISLALDRAGEGKAAA